MNFLSALKRNKKEERNFFLALLLKPNKVGAILIEKTDHRLEILSSKESLLNKPLEELESEELVTTADEVVSFVENSLPPGEKMENTVFAIPRDWQDEGKIKKEYQPRFKQLCDDLSLIPIGFIVSMEAIVIALQKDQGAPLSGLFVEVAQDNIFVYLVRNGNILQVLKGEHESEETVAETVEKLFSQIDAVDVLPPKIFVLDYERAANVQQDFLSRDWKKELPFLHIPQVVVLEKGYENEAVIQGVAAQMEASVAAGTAVTSEEETETLQGYDETVNISDAEEFGFVKDQDVQKEPISAHPHENIEELPIEAESEPTVSRDEIANVEPVINDPLVDHHEKTASVQDIEDQESKEEPVYSDTLLTRIQGLNPMPKVKNLTQSPKLLLAMPSAVLSRMSVRTWAVLIGFIAIAAGSVYGYYSYLLKAEIVVFAQRKVFDNQQKVVLAANTQTSADEGTVRIEELSIPVDGDESKATTGKKDTGDKAKGEVTVYNKTERERTFEKGTVLASNGLEFVLTEDVKVASTSPFSTSFSSVKAKVEASKFGKEYNLSSNTNFTVGGQSTTNYFAKNDSAFSGGTKKEVRVVSANDLEELETSLIETLTQQAQEQAKSRITDDQVLLPKILSYEFTERKFSKKTGDEASSVSLAGTIEFKVGAYSRSDLQALVEGYTKDSVPQGYRFVEEDSDIQLQDIVIGENGESSGSFVMSAVYMPSIDTGKIAQEVSRKSISQSEETVRRVNGVSDVTIIEQTIPFVPKFMPFNPKNIKVTVKSDG